MNIYENLNECIKYIEDNLSNTINYSHISKIFGCNISTVQKVFSLITGMTITEYVRRRRLSVAVSDIMANQKIIDVAYKYGYKSAESFARSFKKMHGILPSKVKNNNIICNLQPMLKFSESKKTNNILYRIEELDKFTLYGIKEKVDPNDIPKTAEGLWMNIKEKYPIINKIERYGITIFENNQCYYWCSTKSKIAELEKIVIPRSKWIIFKTSSFIGKDIQKTILEAIENHTPNIGLKVKNEIQLEKYNLDNIEVYIMLT